MFAAGDTITTHFLLKYLEEFHALYPDIRIEMANSYSSQMLSFVKEGKADLAFVNMPLLDDDLIIEVNDVPTNSQLTIVCSGEKLEIDALHIT